MPVKVLQSVANAELENTLRALQAEVATLREENASLRLHQFRGSALPGRIEGLRELRTAVRRAQQPFDAAAPAGHPDRRDAGDAAAAHADDEVALDITDDAWRVLTETLVVRDVLLEMCTEVTALTQRLADRLEALAVWSPSDRHGRPARGTPVTPSAGASAAAVADGLAS